MKEEATFRLHKRQGDVLLSPAQEILYGGAAGGGKSHLMRVMAILCCLYIPGVQCFLFRRYSDDLIKNHFIGNTSFPNMIAPFSEAGLCSIVSSPHKVIRFRNGSNIMACHCQYEQDIERFRGAEIHLLLIDELTLFTDTMYRYLRGRCRASDSLKIPKEIKKKFPGILFPKIVCGSNPGGPGHNWVKATFIDPKPSLEIWKTPVNEGGKTRQYIPAKLKDNPSLDYEEYANNLKGLGQDWLVQAMLDGNWNITAGGALDDIWKESIHVMKPFKIPETWYKDRTFDWGSSVPWACLFFAESDGSDVAMPDGTIVSTIPGDLFVIGEGYGMDEKPNAGTKQSPGEVAEEIKGIERELGYEIHDGAADNQIFQEAEGRGHTIARVFADHGIYWRASNKTPGSRKNGLVLVRERLNESLKRESKPGLFVFDVCRNFIRTVPTLQRNPRDPEDVDTTQEDHIWDCLRYRICGRDRSNVSVESSY